MGDKYVGFDKHGRRDIYSNFKDPSKTIFDAAYDQPKSYAIKRNYDNPDLGRQMMEQFNRSTDSYSGDTDHLSEDSSSEYKENSTRSPKKNKDSYFTYDNGDYKRY